MRRLLRKAIAPSGWPLSATKAFFCGGGVRILMYHRVTELSWDRLSVHPSEFQRQVDYLLTQDCRIVKLSDLPELKPRQLRSPPALALTFDDGYRDFYETVFPVLKARRIPATIFIVVGLLEGEVQLERYRNCPETAEPLTWDMLREMSSQGVTVGAHSLTHRELPRLSREEAEREIAGSARVIGERLGERPRWFAYPRGKLNPGLEDLVKRAGYGGAVTARPGSNRYPLNLFSLRRTEISGDDDLGDFKMKLRGAFDPWHSLWQIFKREAL